MIILFLVQLSIFIVIAGLIFLSINITTHKFKINKLVNSYGLMMIIGILILISSLQRSHFKELSLLSIIGFAFIAYSLAALIRIMKTKSNT